MQKPHIENLHAFAFSRKTIPLSAINNLHEKLIQFGTQWTLHPGQKYIFSEEKDKAGILMMTEGVCSMCHQEGDLHAATIFSPSVLGLISAYGLYYDVEPRPRHYICAETSCHGYLIDIEKFLECADKFGLWHDIARILAYRVMVMSAREMEFIGVDSYTKMRALLNELWLYPEHYRNQINVTPFLQRRSGLSRSQVMRIISELRSGGYIVTSEGKLLLLKTLPIGY